MRWIGFLIGFLGGLTLAVSLGVLPSSAGAAEHGKTPAEATMGIELNKMEGMDSACRVYLVFENDVGRAFETYNLDLVMFGPDGGIVKRLAVNAGPIAKDKTLVKLFDANGLDCAEIGRLLLNAVIACETAGGETPDCTALSAPRSRVDTAFVK
jgi:hypothetical protein